MAISTRHYYWKPSHALFHAFELETYAAAGARFERPVLDLGCGDGTFGAMLRERGLLEGPDVAIEIDPRRAARARARGAGAVLLADARALPLRSGAFRSVLANSVLNALPSGVEDCLDEVWRTLVPDGSLVLTVPAERVQLLPRGLRRVGARRAAEAIERRSSRRLDELQARGEAGWLGLLASSGFAVESVLRYFTGREAFWSDLLGLQPFRVLAPLRLAGQGLARVAAAFEKRLFGPLFMKGTRPERLGRAGASLLIVARKTRMGALVGSPRRGA